MQGSGLQMKKLYKSSIYRSNCRILAVSLSSLELQPRCQAVVGGTMDPGNWGDLLNAGAVRQHPRLVTTSVRRCGRGESLQKRATHNFT